jgi:hypothetical protein
MVVLPWSTWAMMAILRRARDMYLILFAKKARHSSTTPTKYLDGIDRDKVYLRHFLNGNTL